MAANGNKVYIGLYRNRTWSDGSDSSFRHWKSGQPDNMNYAQKCTAMSFSDSGRWTDESCDSALPFFCYRGKNPLHEACCFCKLFQATLYTDSVRIAILGRTAIIQCDRCTLSVTFNVCVCLCLCVHSCIFECIMLSTDLCFMQSLYQLYVPSSSDLNLTAFVTGLRMVVDTETDLTDAEIDVMILKPVSEGFF